MGLICRTSKTWITKEVLDPVKKWVKKRKKKCKSKKRWWQRLWCWFVTFWVQITEWIVRNIIVPILQTICFFVTWLVGSIILYTIAIPYGALTDTFTFSDWVKEWFIEPTKITFVGKEDDPNKPNSFIYTFTCNCKKGKQTITVKAKNDIEAQKLATKLCKSKCK